MNVFNNFRRPNLDFKVCKDKFAVETFEMKKNWMTFKKETPKHPFYTHSHMV